MKWSNICRCFFYFLTSLFGDVKDVFIFGLSIGPFLICGFMHAGPFKINGVPLRRVNQSYVIGTSTKVDISGVSVEKFDDKYFAKEAEKKKKKGEGEFFEAEKEVSYSFPRFFLVLAWTLMQYHITLPAIIFYLLFHH